MNKIYADTFSNEFDSVSAVDINPMSYQAILTKMIICLRAPVLSLPQIVDSMPILLLASCDPDYRKLFRIGVIGTSLYGKKITSLKAYVQEKLAEPNYIFSALPFLYEKGRCGDFSSNIKDCLAKILNGKKDVSLPQNDLNDVDQSKLAYFLTGVEILNECIEEHNYRSNLESSITMFDVLNTKINNLKKSYGDDKVIKSLKNININYQDTRSDCYERLDSQQIEDETRVLAKSVVDIAYNQMMGGRITVKTPVVPL